MMHMEKKLGWLTSGVEPSLHSLAYLQLSCPPVSSTAPFAEQIYEDNKDSINELQCLLTNHAVEYFPFFVSPIVDGETGIMKALETVMTLGDGIQKILGKQVQRLTRRQSAPDKRIVQTPDDFTVQTPDNLRSV